MNQPNPFDFSDFGPPRGPTGPSSRGSGQPGPQTGGEGGGFDPWAGQQAPPNRQSAGRIDVFGPSGVTGVDPLGGGGGAAQLTTAGPPLKWFAVAIVLALTGAVVVVVGALAGGIPATALGGWLLAGPIAIGALAVYTRVDTRRRSESIYSAPSWTTKLYWVVLATCLLGIGLGAWQIALWVGRF